MAAGITAIAHETVEARDRSPPMLRPMSEIAGRLSVRGRALPQDCPRGRGVLLAGVPGSARAWWW